MTFWYTIDNPRNRPCWDVNPKLWDGFTQAMLELHGTMPDRSELYTEQYVVQRMDMEPTAADALDEHEA